MLTVHHLQSSLSERAVWLCEELELDYGLKTYPREPTGLAPPEYKALHPAGTSPTITDGEVALCETEAVFEYILARYGQGRLVVAPDERDYAEFVFWRHYPHGSMMENLAFEYNMAWIGAVDAEGKLDGFRARFDKAYAMLEARLSQAPYLGGDRFTVADIMATYVLTTARSWTPRSLDPYPQVKAYAHRMCDRPAYVRAMAKAEPGREPYLV